MLSTAAGAGDLTRDAAGLPHACSLLSVSAVYSLVSKGQLSVSAVYSLVSKGQRSHWCGTASYWAELRSRGSGHQQLPLVLVTPNPGVSHVQTPLVGRTTSGCPALEARRLLQVVRDSLPRETRAKVRPEGGEGARDAEIWETVFQPEAAASTKAQAGGSWVCPPERRPAGLERSETRRGGVWKDGAQARPAGSQAHPRHLGFLL